MHQVFRTCVHAIPANLSNCIKVGYTAKYVLIKVIIRTNINLPYNKSCTLMTHLIGLKKKHITELKGDMTGYDYN